MTFDQWCTSKKIQGNFKEALIYQLLSEHSIEEVDTLSPEVWAQAWNKVLDRITKNLLRR